MVTRILFNEVIKDVLGSLYDVATLETHPALFTVIRLPVGYSGNKGEFVAQLILNAIERLRPTRKDLSVSAPEWRPYLVLKKRYVDGIAMQDLADQMAVSPRQLRRDHHKALEALTEILWTELYPNEPVENDVEPGPVIEVHNEMLDLVETIHGVFTLVKKQFENRGVDVVFSFPPDFIPVITDRVILRQVLISLFRDILQNALCDTLTITCNATGRHVGIKFAAHTSLQPSQPEDDEDVDEFTAVKYWCERIHARLEDSLESAGNNATMNRVLWLPQPLQKIMLVIDDQAAVMNMFQRYLSQTDLLVIGVSDPEKAVTLARHFQPALITLDVMMPQMDGWELLQTIKLDEKLKNIPVIVCSAWDDPDLSHSLGASVYLKKPVTQKMLLDAVKKLIPLTI
jgi:CheY-like chemotaxis protein